MTGVYGGPTLKGGLTGFVTGWDGLTLAGLDDAGQVVIYWWAPGIAAYNGGDPNKWLTQNMTTDLAGPTFVGQLDAFVTSWGGLNIVGRTARVSGPPARWVWPIGACPSSTFRPPAPSRWSTPSWAWPSSSTVASTTTNRFARS